MFYTIYETTNQVNGKKYIGLHQTTDLNDSYLGSGELLAKAIKKYGVSMFTKQVLFVFDNREDMVLKEKELVTEEVIRSDLYYNIALGGKGSFHHINSNPELKARTASAAGKIGGVGSAKLRSIKRSTDPSFVNDELEHLKRIREKAVLVNTGSPSGFSGMKHSSESKRSIGLKNSAYQTGTGNSQYGSKWIHHPEYGPKKIASSSVDDYLSQGWALGRIPKN